MKVKNWGSIHHGVTRPSQGIFLLSSGKACEPKVETYRFSRNIACVSLKSVQVSSSLSGYPGSNWSTRLSWLLFGGLDFLSSSLNFHPLLKCIDSESSKWSILVSERGNGLPGYLHCHWGVYKFCIIVWTFWLGSRQSVLQSRQNADLYRPSI